MEIGTNFHKINYKFFVITNNTLISYARYMYTDFV